MEDMSIQLTLIGEEIEQLAKATGYNIKEKEDLFIPLELLWLSYLFL